MSLLSPKSSVYAIRISFLSKRYDHDLFVFKVGIKFFKSIITPTSSRDVTFLKF